ncbi:hypothetical protein C9940_02775 [Pseudidiomarina aestuarii]|uniref:Uncharacterized protein n=1 Tax=Pseudidiomarina aestuarii TaxID=624146 RepID=A0A2T4D6W6_9GAMM|nr:hypothetical protein C9988_00310 [Pseudidiomarina aestuarii]PTB86076.1 hypothetical protein C9939_03900 [Pseudidiomarina aestuarii]PTB86348.1 hypothetical protein C9940_02775 [Pseudidiomarina aestuarii]PTB89560.1 hypothetical protein C9928_03090 [Pseudidiomarina aestuarii]PTB89562.1 hypothetical protein C9928_03100 [Pseudidiomarina aestuarii]
MIPSREDLNEKFGFFLDDDSYAALTTASPHFRANLLRDDIAVLCCDSTFEEYLRPSSIVYVKKLLIFYIELLNIQEQALLQLKPPSEKPDKPIPLHLIRDNTRSSVGDN